MKVWHEVGTKFTIRNPATRHEKLPPAIYILEWDAAHQEFFLEYSQREYKFGKLYSLDTDFINRVMKSYSATTSNLGVLLVGTKGTGKSVTSKQLCNRMISAGVPVIVIPKSYDGIGPFLNSVNNDVAIFVDEYEKTFDSDRGRDTQLLSIMDGAFDNGFRRAFFLTSNSLRVNDNMIQRPGRVRYLKKYEDTPLSTIITIVDDRLQNKSFRDETIKFISEMEIITIDIICAIIDEVNIHDEPPAKFAEVFNIKKRTESYDVYVKEGDDFKLHTAFVENVNDTYSANFIGDRFCIGKKTMGYICEVLEPNIIEVNKDGCEETEPKTVFKIMPGKVCHPLFKTYF